MRMHRIALLVLPLLSFCTRPPPDAYVGTSPGQFATIALGSDSSGATCKGDQRSNGDIVFYCGEGAQPSGRVGSSPVAAGTSPMNLAINSSWRTGLESRYACDHAPASSRIADAPAADLNCKRRIGGFPRLARVTVDGDRAYFGDADPAAADALQRAFGIATHKLKPEIAAAVPADLRPASGRAYEDAATSSDVNYYDKLMYDAAKANLTAKYAESERDYGLAVELLFKKQGKETPSAADPLLHRAMQLSNMGLYKDSDLVFSTADKLINTGLANGDLLDSTLPATQALYRALSLLNQDRPKEAAPLLDKAEAGFKSYVREEDRNPVKSNAMATRQTNAMATRRGLTSAISSLSDAELYRQLESGRAALGLIAVKRARAVALKMQGRLDASLAESEAAEQEASRHSLAFAQLEARILRTSASIYEARADAAVKNGQVPDMDGNLAKSLDRWTAAASAFDTAYAQSRPSAETDLKLAAQRLRGGDREGGLKSCARAIDTLKFLKSGGASASLMMPCVDGYFDAKAYDRMFEAAQLAQSSITTTQIAQAAARMASERQNSAVGALFGQRADIADRLEGLNRQRRGLEDEAAGGGDVSAELRALDVKIAEARAAGVTADAAVEKAAPRYRDLIQDVVSADAVFKVLGQNDAFVSIVLADDHGWTLMLHDGHIDVVRVEGGLPAVQSLVEKIRRTMEPGSDGRPPQFDSDSSSRLFTALFAGTAPTFKDIKRLVVAPSGPLLSLPFGLLLTGSAGPDLAKAPWLMRDMTIEHVPAPANLVVLHDEAGSSLAQNSWIGFGDPQPVTRSQAMKLYAAPGCETSASLLSGLPRLPGTVAELNQVRETLNGASSDQMLSVAFTRHAVMDPRIKNYRIVHFATHGLLPSDIECQTEAAIVMSASPGAESAGDALLTASQIARLQFNADAVILSACNSGGPEGKTGGESLSGLARSFFFAGARALLVTHWEVNDQVTRILVAGTMKNFIDTPGEGLASALVREERDILTQAVGDNAEFAHPYYWSPLALIGDGGARTALATH